MRTMAFLCLTAMFGCGGSDPQGVPGGTIRGTITYSGAKRGPLTVAASVSWPPMGAPAAFTRKGTPAFPAEYEITGVAPGAYTVFAVLDNNNDNPQSPGADDPVTPTAMPITITAEKGALVDLTLADK